jgi:signal peptidase II
MQGWRPSVLIALGIALLDWSTKFLVARSIPLHDFREVIAGRLAFWHVRNPAMALGLWSNFSLGSRKMIALVAALLGALVIFQILGRGHRFPRSHRGWAWLFVGLVLGGMLGNLGERVVHWGVTDFLSVRWGNYWLPPGNLADIALFLSLPMSIPVVAFELLGRARRGRDTPPAPATVAG